MMRYSLFKSWVELPFKVALTDWKNELTETP